jgi:hypothetical protein
MKLGESKVVAGVRVTAVDRPEALGWLEGIVRDIVEDGAWLIVGSAFHTATKLGVSPSFIFPIDRPRWSDEVAHAVAIGEIVNRFVWFEAAREDSGVIYRRVRMSREGIPSGGIVASSVQLPEGAS